MPLFFLRSCFLFPIRLSHAGDDEVLLPSPAETSLHHCSGILHDMSIPSWKQRLWICRTQPQGWQSCVHPECAHEQHDVFSSSDIIIYQAEVSQIRCTTTIISDCFNFDEPRSQTSSSFTLIYHPNKSQFT